MLDAIAALIVAALTGLGVGGGGLLVLYLTVVNGMDQAEAQGVNIVFFLCASAGAFILNCKKRQFDYKRVLILSLSGAVAALGGALLSSAVRHALLGKLYGGLLIFSGLTALFKKE